MRNSLFWEWKFCLEGWIPAKAGMTVSGGKSGILMVCG